jgi:hypothetical protein
MPAPPGSARLQPGTHANPNIDRSTVVHYMPAPRERRAPAWHTRQPKQRPIHRRSLHARPPGSARLQPGTHANPNIDRSTVVHYMPAPPGAPGSSLAHTPTQTATDPPSFITCSRPPGSARLQPGKHANPTTTDPPSFPFQPLTGHGLPCRRLRLSPVPKRSSPCHAGAWRSQVPKTTLHLHAPCSMQPRPPGSARLQPGTHANPTATDPPSFPFQPLTGHDLPCRRLRLSPVPETLFSLPRWSVAVPGPQNHFTSARAVLHAAPPPWERQAPAWHTRQPKQRPIHRRSLFNRSQAMAYLAGGFGSPPCPNALLPATLERGGPRSPKPLYICTRRAPCSPDPPPPGSARLQPGTHANPNIDRSTVVPFSTARRPGYSSDCSAACSTASHRMRLW